MERNRTRKMNLCSAYGTLDRCFLNGDIDPNEQIYSELLFNNSFATKMISDRFLDNRPEMNDGIDRHFVLSTMVWEKFSRENQRFRKAFWNRSNAGTPLEFPTYQQMINVAIKRHRRAILNNNDDLKNHRLAALGINRNYVLIAWYPRLETAERIRGLLNDEGNVEDVIAQYRLAPVIPNQRAEYGDFFLPRNVYLRENGGVNNGIVVPNEDNGANEGNGENVPMNVNEAHPNIEVNRNNDNDHDDDDDDDDDYNNNNNNRRQEDQPIIEQHNLPGQVENRLPTNNKRPNGQLQELTNNDDSNNKRSKIDCNSGSGSIGGEFDFGSSTSKQQQPQTGNPSNQTVEHSSQMMMDNVQVPNNMNLPQALPKLIEIMKDIMNKNDLKCEYRSILWDRIIYAMDDFTKASAYLPLAKAEQNSICLVCERYDPNAEMVSCQRCTASMHSKCYPKMKCSEINGDVTCEACDFTPFWEVGCADCGKADGGVYRRYRDGFDIWVHAIYMLFVGLQLIPNSCCCYCKRQTTGTAVCSQPECPNTFHPCCAANDGNIRPTGDNRWEGICNQHSDVSLQLTRMRMQEFGVDEEIIIRRIQKQREVVKKLNFALVLPIGIVHEFVKDIQTQPVTGFTFTKSFFVNVLKCWVAAKKSVGGDNLQKVGFNQLCSYGINRMTNAIKCQAEKRSRRLAYPLGYDPFLDFTAQDIFLRALVNLEETGVAKFGDHHFVDVEPIESSIRRLDESELSDNIDDSGNGLDEDDTEEEKGDDEETEVENS